jgi:hypothetical protein
MDINNHQIIRQKEHGWLRMYHIQQTFGEIISFTYTLLPLSFLNFYEGCEILV